MKNGNRVKTTLQDFAMKKNHRSDHETSRHYAIIILAKTPELQRSSPDEPYAALPWDDLDTLSAALIEDQIEQACQVQGAEVVLFFHTARPRDEFLRTFNDRVHYIELSEKNFPHRFSHLSEYLASQPYQRVIVVFENYPLLSAQMFIKSFEHLGSEEEKIVVGQSDDGRCCYVGLRTPYHSFFSEIGQELVDKPFGILSHACRQNAILCPTQPLLSLTSGFHLAALRQMIDGMEEGNPVFPGHTANVFKMFDKKYKLRKPAS